MCRRTTRPAMRSARSPCRSARLGRATSPHSAITVGITKLYICTSNASSAQPPKQAPMVRRSLGFNSPNQPSIALHPYGIFVRVCQNPGCAATLAGFLSPIIGASCTGAMCDRRVPSHRPSRYDNNSRDAVGIFYTRSANCALPKPCFSTFLWITL